MPDAPQQPEKGTLTEEEELLLHSYREQQKRPEMRSGRVERTLALIDRLLQSHTATARELERLRMVERAVLKDLRRYHNVVNDAKFGDPMYETFATAFYSTSMALGGFNDDGSPAPSAGEAHG